MDSQRDNNSDTEKSDNPDSKPSRSRASSSKWAHQHFTYYSLQYISWTQLLPFYIADELVTESSEAWIHELKKEDLLFFSFCCNDLWFICREGIGFLLINVYLPVILANAAVSFNIVYRRSIMKTGGIPVIFVMIVFQLKASSHLSQ